MKLWWLDHTQIFQESSLQKFLHKHRKKCTLHIWPKGKSDKCILISKAVLLLFPWKLNLKPHLSYSHSLLTSFLNQDSWKNRVYLRLQLITYSFLIDSPSSHFTAPLQLFCGSHLKAWTAKTPQQILLSLDWLMLQTIRPCLLFFSSWSSSSPLVSLFLPFPTSLCTS